MLFTERLDHDVQVKTRGCYAASPLEDLTISCVLQPPLSNRSNAFSTNLDGIFLVRIEHCSYRWHPQKPFVAVRFFSLLH
jgi:hypothetical protein